MVVFLGQFQDLNKKIIRTIPIRYYTQSNHVKQHTLGKQLITGILLVMFSQKSFNST